MAETDTVVLTFPRDPRWFSVARLVVGGMAAPLQMSFDALDDIQLAISSLLDHDDLPGSGDLTLKLSVDGEQLIAAVGGFANGGVQDALDRSEATSGALGLRGVLATVVDDVHVTRDEAGEWITLTKRVGAHA
jgi:hypothetical protein